ncbi:MAG: Hpt domain-containing protein [Alphaproteobacteria bacterium]|nr:Hpt domain-containing protein [Alphaproteobacteria bacterium]
MDDHLFEKQLLTEFLDSVDDCSDQIEALSDKAVRAGGDTAPTLHAIRREAHKIKGVGGSYGFPLVSTIAHRLEDFLAEETSMSVEVASGVAIFLDHIRAIARSGKEPTGQDATDLLRTLPSRLLPADFTVSVVNVEVLLGVPSAITAKIVRDILQNCGFRVVQAKTMLDCFTQSFRAKPDAVIFSQTLDELSGAELVTALGAMPTTKSIPSAVLTSLALNHPGLSELPKSVSVVRMGKEHFDSDMAAFLSRIEIP